MHPEVVSDKPGKCPTCGMELIRMEKGKIQTEPEPHQMDMMMCPMHGMMGMDHKHNDQKNHNRKWLRPAGIAMGAMMVAMIIIVGSR